MRTGQLACTFGIMLGLYLTLGSRDSNHKFIFSAATLGAALTGLSLSKQDEAISARLQDADDIALDAWQSRLWRLYRSESAHLEIEPISDIEEAPEFNLTDLTDTDTHSVLGIVAPPHGGKSVLCKFLAKHILNTKNVVVYDSYGHQDDWQGFTIYDEFPEMLAAMKTELPEIETDRKLYRQKKRDFDGTLSIIEEGVVTFNALKKIDKNITEDWLLKYTSTTRKIKRRLCIVSVYINGAYFGTTAEARNQSTLLFPGKKGCAIALADTNMLKLGSKENKHLASALQRRVDQCDRPCLVYYFGKWYFCEIPELTESGDPIYGRHQQTVTELAVADEIGEDEEIIDVRKQLDSLYHGQSADRFEQSEEEDVDNLNDNDHLLDSLRSYIRKKKNLPISKGIKNTWGKNNGLDAASTQLLILELLNEGSIKIYTPLGRREDWVEWIAD
jgi:hypothetical protein